jgi:predicted O-methyltransferase YrrM
MNMLEDIAIDDAHCDLIYGLVRAQKPFSVLEIGFGSGKSYKTISKGLAYNGGEHQYTIVDNWHDWGGKRPDHAGGAWLHLLITEAEEGEFVNSCTQTFDFILIDADHSKSDHYFQRVYNNLLNHGGILIYHDVSNSGWINLSSIEHSAAVIGGEVKVFNKNSSHGERCDRGLLVIFK